MTLLSIKNLISQLKDRKVDYQIKKDNLNIHLRIEKVKLIQKSQIQSKKTKDFVIFDRFLINFEQIQSLFNQFCIFGLLPAPI